MRVSWIVSLAAAVLFAGMARGVSVTVHQQMQLGDGEVAHLMTSFASTDETFTSLRPHEVDGWQFVGWEITPIALAPNARYPWGQCVERVRFVPKDAVVTLTAHYEKTDTDSDQDGLPDATELFWFGTLEHDGNSDVDGDGLSFAEELQAGTQPGLANKWLPGGIASETGGETVHNLWFECGMVNTVRLVLVTFRSEPEGVLFPTTSRILSTPYMELDLPPLADAPFVTSSERSPFAYWTVNGERLEDQFGKALPSVINVPRDLPRNEMRVEVLECVAHCVEDPEERMMAHFGPQCSGPDSDDDGDGFTAREEWAAGTNPFLRDEVVVGGITSVSLGEALYDPEGQAASYTLRSEPEGALFATQSGKGRVPGEIVRTDALSPRNSTFAYWTVNGVRQADDWGVALDALDVSLAPGENEIVAHTAEDTFERFSLYWYGDTTRPATDDSDGDGIPLSEEFALYLNPRLPNTLKKGGITVAEGDLGEVNLQGFDQQSSILVADDLEALFATTDPATGTIVGGTDFGSPVTPVALDLTGDGLHDLLIASATGLRLYVNQGSEGNPSFAPPTDVYPALQERLATMTHRVLCGGIVGNAPKIWACDNGGAILEYDVSTGALTDAGVSGFPVWSAETGLATLRQDGACVQLGDGFVLPLDVPAEDITSSALADATGDGAADLLVADASGRVSLYARTADGFALEHRVWGGSFAGFAEGLTLAPVDWESDGDLDMLCGTAGGKLLLLSDPNVGRPSNLRATAGYDNVLLEWDPNGQSRVYGYGVYRAQGEDFGRIAEPSLPTYRDTPPSLAEWAYRVTALSRLWTAGNSVPETFESQPSEVVRVNLGGVTLWMPETLTSYDDAEIALPITVDNSKGLGAFTLAVTYDPAFVEPLRVETTALTAGLTLTATPADGTWTIAAEGALPAGSGPLFRLRFRVKDGVLGETSLRLTQATFTAQDGKPVATNALPIETVLTVKSRPVPATVTLGMADAEAATGETLRVSVSVTATTPIDWATLILTPTFDAANLRLVSREEATEAKPTLTLTFEVLEQHGDDLFATVTVEGTATSANGLPATVVPATATIRITDSNPLRPAVVSLNAQGGSAATASEVTVSVRVGVTGELDWGTLALKAEVEGLLELRRQTKPTAENPVATFTFWVPEQHGDNLSASIAFSGSATSANGLPAKVGRTTVTLTLTDSNPPQDPTEVEPWTDGDTDGDGKLTWNDYDNAGQKLMHYHSFRERPHSSDPEAEDNRIHRSIVEALTAFGKPPADGKLNWVRDIGALEAYYRSILGEEARP